MAISDFGPFDNDDAMDFVELFMDRPSPAGQVREALAGLKDGRYVEADEACTAWAACELVAMAVSEGEGYEPEDFGYTAAARLRPSKKLIDDCLRAMPFILHERSELAELVTGAHAEELERNLASTRQRLKKGRRKSKFRRLRQPEFKSLPAFAIPVGDNWMIGLVDGFDLTVLRDVYDRPPEDASDDDQFVLLHCSLAAVAEEVFTRLGRKKLSGPLAEPYLHSSTSAWGCHSDSNMGRFETSYSLRSGTNFETVDYSEAKKYPYKAELTETELIETLSDFIATGDFDWPEIPTPDELRTRYLDGCRCEWANYLIGDGGGPFSFPKIHEHDVSFFLAPWIDIHLSEEWANHGMCLPDDLFKYFLTGVIGVCADAIPEEEVPPKLRSPLRELRRLVGPSHIAAAVHVLSCLLDRSSVIPTVLREDAARRLDFFEKATALKESLAAAYPIRSP